MKLRNFFIGSLLGDGCFVQKTPNHNTYVVFKHCESQIGYLQWKYNFLKSEEMINVKSKGIVPVNIKEGSCYPNFQNQYRFSTKSKSELTAIKHLTYDDILKEFNEEILAIWILDDGNVYKHITKIGCGNCPMEFCQAIVEILNNNLNLDSYLYKHPVNPKKNYITIRAKSYKNVAAIILKHFPKDLDIVESKFGDFEENKLLIKVKYFADIEPIKFIGDNISNWIDLRAAETVELKAGEFKLIPLGIGMILPDGYEANIVPRSSTFKNYGIIQTNHYGVIDNSYSGDNDQWCFPAYATRDTIINKNDRICQFRINETQPVFDIEEVEHLNNADRNGFGSTGTK